MNSNPDQTNMNAPIDSILSEDELVPSSGFLAAVMDRVHEESRTPPPMPFPWKRAIPGFVLASGVFAWGGFELVRTTGPELSAAVVASPHLPLVVAQSLGRPLEAAGWLVVALAASLGAWVLSRSLAGQSGLL